MALLDLYDMQLATKSKRRPKAYPRPWKAGKQKAMGSVQRPAELQAALASDWLDVTPHEVSPTSD